MSQRTRSNQSTISLHITQTLIRSRLNGTPTQKISWQQNMVRALTDFYITTQHAGEALDESILGYGDKAKFNRQLTLSLSFYELKQRHESIPTAYASTFDWIFEDEDEDNEEKPTSLAKWLQNDNPMY